MAASTKTLQAMVILCDGEDDYFCELCDLDGTSEQEALLVVRRFATGDERKLHSAYAEGKGVKYHFDREEVFGR